MIDLMLNDLGGESAERPMPFAQPQILPDQFNPFIACSAALALQRQASFRGLVFTISSHDAWVEHNRDASAEIRIHERDDSFAYTDHVGGHAHASVPVGVQCVGKVIGRRYVVGGGRGRRLTEERYRGHDGTLHTAIMPIDEERVVPDNMRGGNVGSLERSVMLTRR